VIGPHPPRVISDPRAVLPSRRRRGPASRATVTVTAPEAPRHRPPPACARVRTLESRRRARQGDRRAGVSSCEPAARAERDADRGQLLVSSAPWTDGTMNARRAWRRSPTRRSAH